MGRFSRYCDASVPMPPRDEHLGEAIVDLCRVHGLTHVIATSEELMVALQPARERLAPDVTLLFPSSDVLDAALHKDATLKLAESVSVPVPRTVTPEQPEDIAACRALGFPLVLKPAHRDARRGLVPELAFKVRIVEDDAELTAAFAEFDRAGAYPLVQEFVPGTGVGIFALCRGGEPLLMFQHRRLHEWPPEGGTSVYCESAPLDAEMTGHARRLLAAMRWDGVAMVEFRRDAATGRVALMEVNGRFWGSLPLAVHAGADFPLALYRSFTDDETLDAVVRTGVRCRDLVGDTRWLLRVLRTGSHGRLRALGEWIAAFRPGTRYYGFTMDDPKPAIAGFLLRVRKAIGLLPGAAS